jgi:hypothetical protein
VEGPQTEAEQAADLAAEQAAERKTWSDVTEKRMARIEGASALVQTTYMMERVFNDLLDLYDALGVGFTGDRALLFNGERTAIRRHAENLETHIELMLHELTDQERAEHGEADRRLWWQRRTADERRIESRRRGRYDRRQSKAGDLTKSTA